MRIRVCALVAFTLMASFGTQAKSQTVPATLQACATFTRDGNSLEATVSAGAISIIIDSPSGKSTTVALPIPTTANVPANQQEDPTGCSLVIDRAEDEATIAIPFSNAKAANGSISQTLMVARFNLRLARWEKSFFVEPPPADSPYVRTSHLGGYVEATKTLFVAKSDGRAELYGETEEGADSRPLKIAPHHGVHGLFAGIDTANNRLWGTCPDARGRLTHAAPCNLGSVTLTGVERQGPEIESPRNTHQKGVDQWADPYFFAYPSPSIVVFGGYTESPFERSHSLWIANLANGSVRQMHLHSILHDDAMSGRFAMSPDGGAFAFGITMSKLMCPPCVVDAYSPRGERIVIADIRAMKQVADIKPPNNQWPLGFAIDHRDGKIVLVVNWGNGWAQTQYNDKQ